LSNSVAKIGFWFRRECGIDQRDNAVNGTKSIYALTWTLLRGLNQKIDCCLTNVNNLEQNG
jgi:hypothetical protein